MIHPYLDDTGMGGGRRPEDYPYHYYHWMNTERPEGNDSHSFGACNLPSSIEYSLLYPYRNLPSSI
jgi:hypothetical protein